MTFWSHDKASIRKRERKQNLNEETRHLQWIQEYKTKLNVSVGEIPTIFIGRFLTENRVLVKLTGTGEG